MSEQTDIAYFVNAKIFHAKSPFFVPALSR